MSQAFLIDTNVLSELMRTQPDQQVIRWFDVHVKIKAIAHEKSMLLVTNPRSSPLIKQIEAKLVGSNE
ncbi:hypothetical protein [Pelodictyon phaeoclathratiforme]|jgi:hypothetical protein|uniref:hypothetical protein n=1 Tax=Pelodictyon phaeoclathratiforme TaxID=34090 RepID=UPI0005A212CB|nr:hypothetical protein [Pelodictyon phaeoclathratiforme]MBV5288595.1 hypothetical protein [Pelodictyon phaeoclathratiforme]